MKKSKRHYSLRWHSRPVPKGPDQTPGRWGWKTFKKYAAHVDPADIDQMPKSLFPNGYNRRNLIRARGVAGRTTREIMKGGWNGFHYEYQVQVALPVADGDDLVV